MTEPPDPNKNLTHSQTQIWVGQQLHPYSPLYNMTFAWVFPEALDPDIFQQAWKNLVAASDALRTTVSEVHGQACRQLADPVPLEPRFETRLLDFSRSADAEAEFHQWCLERSSQSMKLHQTLVDSVLVKLGPARTGWYLNLHHMITDAASTVLLYRALSNEYQRLRDNTAEDACATLTPYYETAQRLAARVTDSPAAREHWALRHAPSDRAIHWYGLTTRPEDTSSTRLTLQLDAQQTRALDALCQQSGFVSLSRQMSTFALLATLTLSWLHRISGQSELGFDAPVSGRPNPRAKRAPGLFIEMFPFAVSVAPDESFRSLASKCLEEAERFLRHAHPGSSAPSGGNASNIVLNYFPEAFGDFAGIPARVEWVHPGHGDSVHALRLQVHDFNGTGRLTLHFDFNQQALPAALRQRSLQHFEKIMAALLHDPDQPIASVDVLTDSEPSRLGSVDASAGAPHPQRSVIALLREQAERGPELIAVREADTRLNYATLWQQVEALASTLIQTGVTAGDYVAISGHRCIHTVIALLATLRAGAAYVPIDPAYPSSRRARLLEDSGARLLLTESGTQPGDSPAGIDTLDIGAGISAGQGCALDYPEPGLEDCAYLLYTSGSTGQPKGVLIEHGGLVDYLQWASRQYVRDRRLRFPLFTSLSFDLTVTSLYLPLITGGVLDIYPQTDGPVDTALLNVIAANRVDFIKLTPSHLTLLTQMRLGSSRIRCMVVGGEDLKTRLAAAAHRQLDGQLEIYNEYGPTEAVVGCVLHRFEPDRDTAHSVPIGVPADHVEVEILNHLQSPVPQGVAGELWISRFGLARGYHNLERLSNERFQVHPHRAGLRRYRSGDLVRMAENGTLHYLGRVDRQIKIAGQRVEPGEIEAALLSLPGVEQCAVLASDMDAASNKPAIATSAPAHYCKRCGLPSNYPGAIFDQEQVCNICRSYDAIKDYAQAYFKTMEELRGIFRDSAAEHQARYDCMMLLSGGKDSSYALCQLVEMGLSVYAYTLDNGFIAEGAKDNIRRITQRLGVPVEFGETPAMNAIFRDSLQRNSNVCHGCFKTIYTLSTIRARDLGIPIIVTGLSRGQMFETRLSEDMFRNGRCSPEEVDEAVLAARKVYHRVDDEVRRSLDVRVFEDDRIFDQVRFVDFYRYHDVGLSEMLDYLETKVPWVRPQDTGRSTNCLINDAGIYVHQHERGYHNYALPYSWDVRLGHKTREAAHQELHDDIDIQNVQQTLAQIGYQVQPPGNRGDTLLNAYYVASGAIDEDRIRQQLAQQLPAALIPARLQRLDALPLTAHGKVDTQALAERTQDKNKCCEYRAPQGPVEEYLVELWQEELALERIGVDDGFFTLGGTSLVAMRVMIKLCREFDIDLPLQTLFTHPRLGDLARIAEDRILADVEQAD